MHHYKRVLENTSFLSDYLENLRYNGFMKKILERILHSDNNIAFAYLFGSYADGSFSDESDVDIAVYLQEYSLDTQLTLHHKLEKKFHKKVDLVCLNDIKNIYLLESIITKGVVVKESDERAAFEVAKQHIIIDFKNFKKYIDAA